MSPASSDRNQFAFQNLDYALDVYANDRLVGRLGFDTHSTSFALADFCIRCGISRSFFARELENLCNIALEQAPLQSQDDAYVGADATPCGRLQTS